MGLISYLYNYWDTFKIVNNLSLLKISYIICLILITWAIGSYQSVLMMRQLNVSIGFLESYFLLVGMHLGNYLPMRAGTLLRMNYFRKVHNVSLLTFSGVFSAKALLMIASTSFLGCIGLVALWNNSNYNEFVLILALYLMLGVFSLSVYFVKLPVNSNTNKNILYKYWNTFHEGFAVMRLSQGLMLKLFSTDFTGTHIGSEVMDLFRSYRARSESVCVFVYCSNNTSYFYFFYHTRKYRFT